MIEVWFSDFFCEGVGVEGLCRVSESWCYCVNETKQQMDDSVGRLEQSQSGMKTYFGGGIGIMS